MKLTGSNLFNKLKRITVIIIAAIFYVRIVLAIMDFVNITLPEKPIEASFIIILVIIAALCMRLPFKYDASKWINRLLNKFSQIIITIIASVCCIYIMLFALGVLTAAFYNKPVILFLGIVCVCAIPVCIRLPFKRAAVLAAVFVGIMYIPFGILGIVKIFAYRPGDYPHGYEGAKWVSENPPAHFEVIDGNCVGEITIDGEAMGFYLCRKPHSNDYFFFPLSSHYKDKSYYDIDKEEALFKGDAKYGKEKITVKITDNSKGFLPKNVRKIKFIQERAGEKR